MELHLGWKDGIVCVLWGGGGGRAGLRRCGAQMGPISVGPGSQSSFTKVCRIRRGAQLGAIGPIDLRLALGVRGGGGGALETERLVNGSLNRYYFIHFFLVFFFLKIDFTTQYHTRHPGIATSTSCIHHLM